MILLPNLQFSLCNSFSRLEVSLSEFDSIALEVLWNRLISIVNEQAAVLINTSFTTVVREAGDLSAAVFDTDGKMLAQAVTGTPGHINPMPAAIRHFLKSYPLDTLEPGDTLITNNPWFTAGHLNDLTVATPVFFKERPVGLFGNICHAMDIGGRTFGAEAREVFEEGLHIPPLKLYRGGEPNSDLFSVIRANVRVPDAVVGDLHAQVTANEVAGRKLVEYMEEYGLHDLVALSDAIISRSEKATRLAIEEIPDGVYPYRMETDGFDDPITIQIAVTVKGSELDVDYSGTSPQCGFGINVVFNYTQAYTIYPLKCAISPEIPNNEGSFRPIRVRAPEGSILNCTPPAAVSARHLIGHFLSMAVFGALSKVIPERVMAEGSAGLWNSEIEGIDTKGKPFAYIFFSAGGTGARPNKDGLSATAFPSGITGVPAEIIENVSPITMWKRELRQDSGGPGKRRGGLGQTITLEIRGSRPAIHSCMYDRIRFPARGFGGGLEGAAGEVVMSDGTHRHPKRKYELQPGQRVTLRLPGGGGFYPPSERDPDLVLEDVIAGLVSVNQAKEFYRVIVDLPTRSVNRAETRKLRER